MLEKKIIYKIIGIALNTIMGLFALALAFIVKHQFYFPMFNIMITDAPHSSIGNFILIIIVALHLSSAIYYYNIPSLYYIFLLICLLLWGIIIWSYSLI